MLSKIFQKERTLGHFSVHKNAPFLYKTLDFTGAKEKDYDPHLKTSTLQPVWISQSSSKQRKGRAGRTKAGVCFHLFSSTRHQSMRPFVESELLRTPLVSFVVAVTRV